MSAARRAECDRAIAQAVAASSAFAAAAVVMAYCRAGSEADVSALAALARAQGKAVVYPHCTARTEMEALLPEADGAFVTDCNGMRSPDPARAARIDPERIDLVLLPCAAFSEFSSILRTASNASSNSSDSRLAYRTSIRRTSSADLNRADQSKLLR